MQDRVRRLGVLVAGAFVLVVVSACGSSTVSPSATAPTTAAAGTSSANAAPSTEQAAPATDAPAAASRPLARVFPAVDAPTCVPSAQANGAYEVRTQAGARPVEAYTCDYSAVAPGAQAVFAQWASEADARAWYQDTVAVGPRIESNDRWTFNGQAEGDLYTAQQSGGGLVISTGLYDGQAYGWEIQTSTLDESNAVFSELGLQPASAFRG